MPEAPIAASSPSSFGELRFCAFADIHYFPGVFPHDSREWLERILDRAVRSRCDMVIHLGDLTHEPTACRDYVDFYNDFRIPCRHVIGNHDDDGNAHEKTLEAYRLEQGHHHCDHVRLLDGIVYLDLNSVSYQWTDDAHSAYPADYASRWRLADNTFFWDDPLSAIITLTQDGRIRVEGRESRFHLGISPDLASHPAVDPDGRPITPEIQSFDLRMRPV